MSCVLASEYAAVFVYNQGFRDTVYDLFIESICILLTEIDLNQQTKSIQKFPSFEKFSLTMSDDISRRSIAFMILNRFMNFSVSWTCWMGVTAWVAFVSSVINTFGSDMTLWRSLQTTRSGFHFNSLNARWSGVLSCRKSKVIKHITNGIISKKHLAGRARDICEQSSSSGWTVVVVVMVAEKDETPPLTRRVTVKMFRCLFNENGINSSVFVRSVFHRTYTTCNAIGEMMSCVALHIV